MNCVWIVKHSLFSKLKQIGHEKSYRKMIKWHINLTKEIVSGLLTKEKSMLINSSAIAEDQNKEQINKDNCVDARSPLAPLLSTAAPKYFSH